MSTGPHVLSKSVRVLTFKDVNVEELPRNEELALPKDVDLGN